MRMLRFRGALEYEEEGPPRAGVLTYGVPDSFVGPTLDETATWWTFTKADGMQAAVSAEDVVGWEVYEELVDPRASVHVISGGEQRGEVPAPVA